MKRACLNVSLKRMTNSKQLVTIKKNKKDT